MNHFEPKPSRGSRNSRNSGIKKSNGPDRTWRNNDTDGRMFYGYDDKKTGMTDWYDKDGNLDSTTKTPSSIEQEMNDEGY